MASRQTGQEGSDEDGSEADAPETSTVALGGSSSEFAAVMLPPPPPSSDGEGMEPGREGEATLSRLCCLASSSCLFDGMAGLLLEAGPEDEEGEEADAAAAAATADDATADGTGVPPC